MSFVHRRYPPRNYHPSFMRLPSMAIKDLKIATENQIKNAFTGSKSQINMVDITEFFNGDFDSPLSANFPIIKVYRSTEKAKVLLSNWLLEAHKFSVSLQQYGHATTTPDDVKTRTLRLRELITEIHKKYNKDGSRVNYAARILEYTRGAPVDPRDVTSLPCPLRQSVEEFYSKVYEMEAVLDKWEQEVLELHKLILKPPSRPKRVTRPIDRWQAGGKKY